MKKFFADPSAFVEALQSIPDANDRCWSCSQADGLLLTVAVGEQFRDLGLPGVEPTKSIALCPACAVENMNSCDVAMGGTASLTVAKLMNAIGPCGCAGAKPDDRVKARLLCIGGDRVVGRPESIGVETLLERGRPFDATGVKKVRGVRSRCHHNAGLHYAWDRLKWDGVRELASGYALTGGCWRPHSWLWDGEAVLETTQRAETYFGVVLDPVEAACFVVEVIRDVFPSELFQEAANGRRARQPAL